MKDWEGKRITIRMPLKMINELDELKANEMIQDKTKFILEAIQEKLNKEEITK